MIVNTISQISSWVFECGLQNLNDTELIYLNTRPEEQEICGCLLDFLTILNQRQQKDSCFNFPDLTKINVDNNCGIDIQKPVLISSFLGIGINIC